MHIEKSMPESLLSCYLFADVTPEEISKILEKYPVRVRSYKKEQYIVHAEDNCSDLPLLATGCVRGEMSDYSGKTIKIEDLYAPAVLASAFIFGPQNKYPVDIIANSDSKLIFFPKESLMKIFRDYPSILKNFLNDISNRAQFLSRKIRFLSFKTIREKLAYYLLGLFKSQKSDSILIPMTQSKLADFFGVARPSLARILAELEKENIIKVARNQVTILNKDKLSKISSF